MLAVRNSNERGHADHGWLDARHSFSFGSYHDAAHNSFRALRVINEDVIAPGRGFPDHPHRDMEIITYVLSGALRHADSTGSREDIVPGVVQRMSAGSGIMHSEANPSKDEPVHLIQIWIKPDRRGAEPRHESRAFPIHEHEGRLHLIASPDGRDGSLPIYQDASVRAGVLNVGDRVTVEIGHSRHAWVQIARGSVTVNDRRVGGGDGVGVSDESHLTVEGLDDASELLVFDLA